MAWFALCLGVAMQAVITALLGLSLTPADSLVMLVLAALTCTVSGRLGGHQPHAVSTSAARTAPALVRLNAWTAVMLMAVFLGVACHGAPVVFALEATLAPLGVLVWTSVKPRCTTRATGLQWSLATVLAALGIGLVAVLAHVTVDRLTALLTASTFGIIAAFAAAGVVVVSRELGQLNITARQVVGRRFQLTFVIAGAALLTLVPAGMIEPPRLHLGVAAAAALTSIAVPIFLLQYAMHHLSPMSVTAAWTTIPALTFGGEALVGRQVDAVAVLLSLLIVPVSLLLLRAETYALQPINRRNESHDRARRSDIDWRRVIPRVHRAR